MAVEAIIQRDDATNACGRGLLLSAKGRAYKLPHTTCLTNCMADYDECLLTMNDPITPPSLCNPPQ